MIHFDISRYENVIWSFDICTQMIEMDLKVTFLIITTHLNNQMMVNIDLSPEMSLHYISHTGGGLPFRKGQTDVTPRRIVNRIFHLLLKLVLNL